MQGVLSAGAALRPGDVACAVDQHIKRERPRGEDCRQVCVFREHDLGCPWRVVQVFSDLLFGFADIDCQHEQSVFRILLRQRVYRGLIVAAIAAPGGPELQQHDFALHRIVIEDFALYRFRVEPWSRQGAGHKNGQEDGQDEPR